jgi:very-short-patch-repair endonuclease
MPRSPKGLKVQCVCQECEKTFIVVPYLAKVRKYCSVKCRQIACGKRERGENHPLYDHNIKPRHCKICGKLFRPPVSNAKAGRGKFCSLKCYWESLKKRKMVECFACGKKVFVWPSRAHNHRRIFCSNKCKGSVTGIEHGFKKGERPWFIERGLPHPGIISRKPNKIENTLISIIDNHNLPFKYVGNGEFWVQNRNPDFICTNGKKLLVELFGDYWHTRKVRSPEETEDGRKLFFYRYGYKTLIIWEHELEEKEVVAKKIANFMVQ